MAETYKSFREIVRAFPDYMTLAIDCDTTDKVVQKWHERDRIPARYWAGLIQSARRYRILGITQQCLVRLADERRPRSRRLTERHASL